MGHQAVANYQPESMLSWDYWFAVNEETKTYHGYYLQYPIEADLTKRHGHQWVGHAISKDLRNWETVEDALKPIPGTLNDKGIATGSVVRGDDGRWYKWFTLNGSKAKGLALAVSDDLFTWEQKPELFINKRETITAEWQGTTYEGMILADPYVHPEKMDGFYWLTINTHILQPPAGLKKGAVLMMKSKDLLTWVPHKFVAFPGLYVRCETTQTWEHNGKWYLFFGGADGPGGSFHNHIYMAGSFDGPYEAQPWSRTQLPDGEKFYIGKHITDLDGNEYFLAGMKYSALSKPYRVSYGEDGRVLLSERK